MNQRVSHTLVLFYASKVREDTYSVDHIIRGGRAPL